MTAVTGREKGGSEAAAGTRDTTAAGAAKAERSPALTPLILASCAVLVVALGCFALWHRLAQDRAVERAREDALAAAQSAAKDLLSYDYRTLDHDLDKARSEMTPSMARSYDEYWRLLRPSVVKGRVQVLTQVQVSAVTEATAGRVEVLMFVKQISVNAAHKYPQVDTGSPRLVMKKVGKRWLIDGPKMTTPPAASVASPTPSATPAKKPGATPRKTR